LRTLAPNAQGPASDLYPEVPRLKKGTYPVTFKTGEWQKNNKGISTFFPKIRS